MEREGSLLFDIASRLPSSLDAARYLDKLWQRLRSMGFKTQKGTFRIACVDIASIGGGGNSQHPIPGTNRKSRSTIGGVKRCPPKAKVTRSNRVGCAITSMT
jgi:hypothetical protein